MIRSLFASRPDHPLADPKEVKRILAELPPDNAFRAVDEIAGWFESLQHADDFRVDHLFDVVQQLDEAAQPHLRKLARDYLHSPRLSKIDERRLWSINFGFWEELAKLYERCAERSQLKDKGAEALKPSLPLLAARLLAALGTLLKWIEFRYGPISGDVWSRMGRAYLAAEAGKYASKPLQLYPQQPGVTNAGLEYLKALVFHASSMDSLMPLEIELADRLIEHFLPGFIFSAEARQDSVYWVDAGHGAPPMRLAKQPKTMSGGLRFFSPGTAAQVVGDLIYTVERGEVPADLNLGGQYPAKLLLPVLRHLVLYWAPHPPQRAHQRHRVKTRVAVVHGFDDSFTVFAGEVARIGKERGAESWVVDNVSLGGFGAAVDDLRGDWLKVGSLLSLQPDGGQNWLLGAVRRYSKDSETQASVGIKTLSRQAQSIEVMPRTTSSYAASGGVPAIWLREGNNSGEARLVLPPATFDVRESLEFGWAGQRYLLTPIELLESGRDYEVARYRELKAD